MGMTLKELLTKGEGTISAKEAKALAAQCRMDEETLYTLLEERGIKVLEEDASLRWMWTASWPRSRMPRTTTMIWASARTRKSRARRTLQT